MSRENMLSLLQKADMGQLLSDADNALNEVVESVASNGGKGEVVIKITVKEIKGKDAQEVAPVLTYKCSLPPRMSGAYFVAEGGGLTRKHGSQPSLPGTDEDEDDGRTVRSVK